MADVVAFKPFARDPRLAVCADFNEARLARAPELGFWGSLVCNEQTMAFAEKLERCKDLEDLLPLNLNETRGKYGIMGSMPEDSLADELMHEWSAIVRPLFSRVAPTIRFFNAYGLHTLQQPHFDPILAAVITTAPHIIIHTPDGDSYSPDKGTCVVMDGLKPEIYGKTGIIHNAPRGRPGQGARLTLNANGYG